MFWIMKSAMTNLPGCFQAENLTQSICRNVKGFNIINLLYYTNGISIPLGFEVVKKPIEFNKE